MIDIMNAALISQGQYEVSENDGSDEFRLLSRNWPTIVEAELEDGNYNFARQQTELLTRSDGKYGYADAYAVPGDALHVRSVWTEDADGNRDLIEWSQDGAKVYVNAEEGIFIEYMICEEAALWSANFARGVQMKLEAVIARAIREEINESMKLDQGAEFYFQKARANSSRARSASEPYRTGALAQARFRRRV